MPFARFRGGKLPPVHKPTHVSLGDFLAPATEWPSVPPQGWEYAVLPDSWGMLGNDTIGDCAEAGIGHLIQAQTANAGNPLHMTEQQAKALYSAVTGYNPDDPETDQGTVLTDLLTHIQQYGVQMTDASGKEVTAQIVGWAALDVSSLAQTRYAAYTFGGNYEGYQLPSACETDLTNWNFGPGLPIAGGHCVPRVGEGAAGGHIVTWGQVVPVSNEFTLAYRDEAYIIVTPQWLNAQDESPSGLDLDALVAAMKAVGNRN